MNNWFLLAVKYCYVLFISQNGRKFLVQKLIFFPVNFQFLSYLDKLIGKII